MSTTISSDGLEPRRKKALYHAWHRGTKEMDILLGEFADANIAMLPVADLGDLEVLMEETDRDLFSWIIGSEPTPEAMQKPVFAALVAFHAGEIRDGVKLAGGWGRSISNSVIASGAKQSRPYFVASWIASLRSQ